MNGANKGERATGRAVVAAMAAVVLCLPPSGLMAQRQEHSRPAERPHYSAPRQQTHPESPRSAPQYRGRQDSGSAYPGGRAPQYRPRTQQPQYPNRGSQPQYQQRTQPYQNQFQNRGSQPQYPANRPPASERPQFQRPPQNPYAPPQTGARGPQATPQYNVPGNGRQGNRGTSQQIYAPPGHLGSWLNNHKNTPVPQQQQMLRSDPSFRKLPEGEQQRGNQSAEPGEPPAGWAA